MSRKTIALCHKPIKKGVYLAAMQTFLNAIEALVEELDV
jgi:hypothetical protein|tara:strand:- start:423 stop:539 length:117 start_codon:yes stop_codon:yes gene_type:complete